MRQFLLTWYGITDFRASLGFGNTDGPIVAALAAEAYSDVVILGYTRADSDSNECVEAQKSFAAELASIHNAGKEKDWETTNKFVSKYANTAIAHEHFIDWVKAQIQGADGSANIRFKNEKLRELNDTEGIYACAMRALDWVAQEDGEKLVTLYLSPGTPVMAFVWAFAALGHPALKKRLIASPVISKPPETVALPTEWLERHGATQKAARDANNGFDVTFHLLGEQRMPALLGIRQFESKRHVFIYSKEYEAESMRPFCADGEFDKLLVDPWDASAVREQIIRYVEKMPTDAHIGLNLTGGTKLMFAGALAAARALGAVPFYLNSQNRRVTFIDGFRNASIKPIDSVETFLLLNGDGLKMSKKNGRAALLEDRRCLTETLWKYRAKIAKGYKELRNYNDRFKPFRVSVADFSFALDKNKVATIVGNGLNLRFENWAGFAKYLSGGWFEEYVYFQLKPYEDAGLIKDLRVNVELNLPQKHARKSRQWSDTYNELDVVFTDGYSLYIVECKAGNVTQEQVMKLQSIVRFYGGVEGYGILGSCFPPNSASVRKRVKDARLMLWHGKSFSGQLKKLMNRIAARAQSDGEAI